MIELWLFTGLSTIFSITALAVASQALKLRRRPFRRIEELELAIVDMEERHAMLHKSHKRLNSRIAMREARAKKAELAEETPDEPTRLVATDSLERLPEESANEWKRRIRTLIASGKVGPTTGG